MCSLEIDRNRTLRTCFISFDAIVTHQMTTKRVTEEGIFSHVNSTLMALANFRNTRLNCSLLQWRHQIYFFFFSWFPYQPNRLFFLSNWKYINFLFAGSWLFNLHRLVIWFWCLHSSIYWFISFGLDVIILHLEYLHEICVFNQIPSMQILTCGVVATIACPFEGNTYILFSERVVVEFVRLHPNIFLIQIRIILLC